MFGSAEAYGGKNFVSIDGSNGRDVIITKVIAGSGEAFGVENIGGANSISITGGKKITIEDIITGANGQNHFMFYTRKQKNGKSSLIPNVKITNLSYSSRGETLFYFGEVKEDGYLGENGLSLQLVSTFGDQTLSLRVSDGGSGNGSRVYDVQVTSGFFCGNAEYDFLANTNSQNSSATPSANSNRSTKINYWFRKDSIFVGTLGGNYDRNKSNESNAHFFLTPTPNSSSKTKEPHTLIL